MNNMTIEYVAFLRGINVGGRRSVEMSKLETAFRSLGFQNVRTVLASGNVIFEGPKSDQAAMAEAIRAKMESALGLKSDVILRTLSEIRKLAKSDPFKDCDVTPETKLYIAFLPHKSRSAAAYNYESPEKDIQIFGLARIDVGAVLALSPSRGTTALLTILDKQFGRNITTRSWATIQKIAERRILGPAEK